MVFRNYLKSETLNLPKIITCSHNFFTEMFLYNLKALILLFKVNYQLKKNLVELFTFFSNFHQKQPFFTKKINIKFLKNNIFRKIW